jgi:choline dehydrogenase-like flavoprotein
MTGNHYDAIVVGPRCAGSPTAILLARPGHRVVVVDRATFLSDMISTHLVLPPGVATLQRWNLLDRLAATGYPPIDTYSFDFGSFTVSGAPRPTRAPSRTALGGPCRTPCSWTPRPRPEPRFERRPRPSPLTPHDALSHAASIYAFDTTGEHRAA